MNLIDYMQFEGTSEGATKGWDTRGRTGKEDTRNLFSRLTTRKPNDWDEPKAISFNKLSRDQQDAFMSKPKFSIGYRYGTFDEHPGFKQGQYEYHGTRHDGSHYYINTEGFGYPRYVAKIKDVPEGTDDHTNRGGEKFGEGGKERDPSGFV
jgi:hypothetical protein